MHRDARAATLRTPRAGLRRSHAHASRTQELLADATASNADMHGDLQDWVDAAADTDDKKRLLLKDDMRNALAARLQQVRSCCIARVCVCVPRSCALHASHVAVLAPFLSAACLHSCPRCVAGRRRVRRPDRGRRRREQQQPPATAAACRRAGHAGGHHPL